MKLYKMMFLTLSLTPALALADWNLDSEASSFNFVSIKKNSVGELHRFKTLSGSINLQGEANLTLDLSSIDSGIAIRDERMKEHLFETNKFPSAEVSVVFDKDLLSKLKVGAPEVWNVTASIALHGVTVKRPMALSVLKTSMGGITVNTQQPVIVTATDFGMDGGVAKLQELAGLPSISLAVPITATLVFNAAVKGKP